MFAIALAIACLGASPLAAAPRDAGPVTSRSLAAEADGSEAPDRGAQASEAPADDGPGSPEDPAAPDDPKGPEDPKEPEASPTEPAAPRDDDAGTTEKAGRRTRQAADPTPDPTPKPTPWPTPAGVKGLDVSHWNPDVDFGRAAELGIRFVFIKATQGLSFRDDHYLSHASAARAAGLVVGPYHFFDYRKDGRRQARHFLRTLRSTTGLSQLLPLVVDVETLSSLGTPNRKRAKARLHALLDELYRQTGRYPMIYTSRHMWKQVVGEPLGFGGYPLWVACWKCDTVHMPRGWSSWRFWQFGQFRFGNGLPRLDGNVYAADVDRLGRERQRIMRLEGGAEWASAQEVRADLRGYHGKDVRVALDDETFGAWRPFEPALGIDLGRAQGARRVRVQLRSFRNVRSPVIHEAINLDSVAPSVRGPRIDLIGGVRLPKNGKRVRVTATMSASDATSGLQRTVLAASCDGVQRARSIRPASGPELEVDLERSGCVLRASATDRVGHKQSRKLGPQVELIDVRRSSERIRFRGKWRTVDSDTALGGTLARSRSGGATASVGFDGAQFAVVARRGPDSGRLDVSVDGKLVGRLDLYAPTTDERRVVFVGSVPRGSHTLRLRASGQANSRATGSGVSLDAVLVLDRRR